MDAIQTDSWNVNGYPLVFKPWSPTVAEELAELTTVPIWVLFPNLDPCFWSQSALSKVASFVGRPICADEPTTLKSKIAFARILVEVDLSKELPKVMTLHTPYRGIVLQKIAYKWVPHFCHTCKKIGHTQDRCNRNKPKQVYKVKDPVVPVHAAASQDKAASSGSPANNGSQKSTSITPTDTVVTTLTNKYSVLAEEALVIVNLDVEHETIRFRLEIGSVVEIEPGGATDRLVLWDSLRQLSVGLALPWVCLGDFNVSLNADERVGCVLHERDMLEFRDCLADCALSDHPYTRGWFLQISSSTVAFLPAGVSDHAFIVLTIPYNNIRPRSFKYLTCWALSHGFKQLVADQWNRHVPGTKIFSLFSKLRGLRGPLKSVHAAAFSGITKRVAEAKAELTQCQFALQISPLNQLLLAKEKALTLSYLTIKAAKMKILAQKAKIQHLTLSDTNTRYFYTSIAARRSRNTIGIIEDAHGHICRGRLRKSEKLFLPSIGIKALGWMVIHQAFTDAVQKFFRHGKMPRSANSTLIALIPKNETPRTVKDFRPISCCTVFYKVVSKILANRLKTVLGDLVGLEQAAFIEGRDLFDNSMLAHELAFKYHRSLLTPRCILKVDIQKAFDSVNWSFLANCLHGFGFSAKFSAWILACVTSSHFSLNVNGFPTGFFPAWSGLRVNPMKSQLYFGGVSPTVKQLILFTTGYVEGEFPVRYLGIPLFGARLTQIMFIPMMDKIRSKISHWANNLLSYAGKVALINSVIFGIQNFWGASILLPKGIAKKIHKICKDFLWGIEDEKRRFVFKSWDSLCKPGREGGVDIKEILSWNKSQMMSWIKKLETNTPNVWVQWIVGTIDHAKNLLCKPDYKQQIYNLLRQKGSVLPMHKTVGDSLNYPKHKIIGLLAIQNKLPTLDNLSRRGLQLANRCVLSLLHFDPVATLRYCCIMSYKCCFRVYATLNEVLHKVLLH
ncbi:uncharacterized protein LOC141601778 [Silene latifolia]|uniref:uncharacterized protein LOC141601778 n=1 Tax=Silene latifolia TaxID=37657 RepID=UPI003D773FB3